MPVYSMDLKLKLLDDSVLDGQYWLYVGWPESNKWTICSSDKAVNEMAGSFSFSEKLAFEGTTFFKGATEQRGESAITSFRLRIFRGGVIDGDSWRAGKGGTGFWVVKPRPDIKPELEWTIRNIDYS